LQIRHLGGAFTHPSDTPHGPLTEPYALYLFGIPTDPATADDPHNVFRSNFPVLP
jgi:hypothetical protein